MQTLKYSLLTLALFGLGGLLAEVSRPGVAHAQAIKPSGGGAGFSGSFGTYTSTVPSGSNAFVMNQGARLRFDASRYLYSDGGAIATQGNLNVNGSLGAQAGAFGGIFVNGSDALYLSGGQADGATAVGGYFSSKFSYTNASAKVFCFRNNTTVVSCIHQSGAIQPPAFTVATVPSAAGAGAGAIIYVSDGRAGQPGLAMSNGTSWLRTDTYAVISAS